MEGQLQRILGRNVRRLRRERGLTQEQLAEDIGVHRTFQGAIERGERNITLQTLERLAGRLGVDSVSLLTESDGA